MNNKEPINSDTAVEPSPFHSSAVKITLHQQYIQKLLAYADNVGVLERKGGEVNDIIRRHISQPQTPDYDCAKKAIEALTTLKERTALADTRIAKSNAEALERTKDPFYGTPLTQEMVKSFSGDDGLVDDLKASGAVEEADGDPPLPSGGKSDPSVNEADTWFGEKPIEMRAKWTCEHLSGQAQIGACVNHWQREVYKRKADASFADLYNLTKETLKGLDIPRSIDQRGITLTVDLLQEYIDILDGKETPMTEQSAPPKQETNLHWSKVEGNLDKMADALMPLAVGMGFDASRLSVWSKALEALGIKDISEYAEDGKHFKTDVIKAWKAQKAASNPPKEQPKSADKPTPTKPNLSIATNGANPFKKASKQNSKLRLALGGTPGAGKTYTALELACALFPDGKVALIDTEHHSAEKYADIFEFDALPLEDNYSPERYIEMIHAAEENGYDVLIIDSLSHEWEGPGGILNMVDKFTGGSNAENRSAWREMTPRHNALVDAILNAKLHIICTMRCKWANAVESIRVQTENGTKVQKVNKKVIGGLVQRDRIQYEFDLVGLLDEKQNLTIDKSRCPSLTGYAGNKAGKELARHIGSWLGIGQSTEQTKAA